MGPRATTLALTWAVCCLAGTQLLGQPPAPGAEDKRSPVQIYRDAQALIRDGRFDVAAEQLKAFLAANPTEKDFLDLQRTDPTVFLKLRNVPVWSDNAQAQADAIKTVEAIIAKAEEANKKFYRDPARIGRFVHNLGQTTEERIYAEQQLRLAGEAAVPVMVEQLRTANDVSLRAGILAAVSRLGVETVPGFLAATDGLTDDLKLGILRALAARPDVLALLSAAETDFVPHLWFYSAGQGEESRPLREFSAATLEKLAGSGAARRNSEAELLAIADRFARRNARFRNPDRVRLWRWDPATLNVTAADVTRPLAEEYYALKYIRWALALQPTDPAAQELFLAVAVERGVERARFRDLAETDPVLYGILAAAPSDMLIGLLDQALREQRTAMALGLTAVLAARADKAAAAGTPGKPGAFARALDYPDPRVQLAAAIGILKAPVPSTGGEPARVVEVLRRAVAAEPPVPGGKEMGRALIADPSDYRSDKVASFLRQLGYATERLQTGRELLRRVARSADYDLVVIDRHVGDPQVRDLFVQLRASADVARRPVLVVASPDHPRPVPLEQELLRLALLIAVTETSPLRVPPPFAYDPARVVTDVPAEKARIALLRDRQLLQIYNLRLARLARLVDAAGIPQSVALEARLQVRLPQVTYAALAAEYPVSPESAPEVYKRMQAQNAIAQNRPELARAADVATEGLERLLGQLGEAIDPARRRQFEQMLAHIDPAALNFPPDTSRDLAAEAQLQKILSPYPRVAIIPEPYGLTELASDLQAATADPAQLPRDAAEKRRAAKLAVEWLRRLAVGDVPGYDVRPAEAALRQAMRDDELAADAAEAVARIPTAEAQQDLLFLALSAGKPAALRARAADLTIQHIQHYGKLIPANQTATLVKAADAETALDMKARLRVIQYLLAGRPDDLGRVMSRYQLPLPQPPAPKETAPPPAPGAEKKDQGEKKD